MPDHPLLDTYCHRCHHTRDAHLGGPNGCSLFLVPLCTYPGCHCEAFLTPPHRAPAADEPNDGGSAHASG